MDFEYFSGLEFFITFSISYLPQKDRVLSKIQHLLEGFIHDAAAVKKALAQH